VEQLPEDLAEAYAYPDGRLWLRANMISSVDGAATRDERSGGLGNDSDRRLFAVLRSLADVVIVGAGTARTEGYGPAQPGPGGHVPRLAVISRRLDLDFDSPLFTDARRRTILLAPKNAPANRLWRARENADVILAGEDRIDFALAVQELASHGFSRLLCEGGPRILAQMVTAGVLDELCLTVSPLMLAGDGPRIVNGPPALKPAELRLTHAFRDDEDFLFLRYSRR
jgi:riboflavin biosynthesis pyrimidine reductase